MREITWWKGQNPFCESLYWQQGQNLIHISGIFERSVPSFLKNTSSGWVKIEYNLLPGSTSSRFDRERKGASGRTLEIERFLSRVTRSLFLLDKIPDQTLRIDCDILVADGSTRTTCLNAICLLILLLEKKLHKTFLKESFCGISAGIDSSKNILSDLNFEEDSVKSLIDFSFALTSSSKIIEIQGCAEKEPLDMETFTKVFEEMKKSSLPIFEVYHQAMQ
jgi:ribonuclease PH